MNNVDIKINDLKAWIGNEEVAYDEVAGNLEKKFRATIDEDPGSPQKGEIASSGIHWTLAPAIVKSSLLGKDSHPAKGEFLPPVPLPRRMWAGCQTKFFKPLLIGDEIKKVSSIFDINLKPSLKNLKMLQNKEIFLNGLEKPVANLVSDKRINFLKNWKDLKKNINIITDEKFRNKLLHYLNNKNIEASVHFDPPVHKQTFYKKFFKKQKNSLKNTNKLCNEIITLPLYPSMKIKDQKFVIKEIKFNIICIVNNYCKIILII